LTGSNLNEEDERKPQFDTWLLQLPPINLWNVELVYLAFGYDQRWDIKEKYGSAYGDPGYSNETGN
jgi:hypothetical protein